MSDCDDKVSSADELEVKTPWLSGKLKGKNLVLRDVILMMIALGVGAATLVSALSLALAYLHRQDVNSNDKQLYQMLAAKADAQNITLNAALSKQNAILAEQSKYAVQQTYYLCVTGCIVGNTARNPVVRNECRDNCEPLKRHVSSVLP